MAESRINVTVGEQPVQVIVEEAHVDASVNEDGINVASSAVLSGGWPFGENPKRAGLIARDVPTIVDQVAMPGKYRVVKWLVLISDDANDLGVSSEVNVLMRGGDVEFSEYAVLGDADSVGYEIDFVLQAGVVRMVFTSRYDGMLSVNTMKIGMFA